MSPMVFNIGLNRAGTSSLAAAMQILGFRAAHHKHEGTRLVEIISSNIERGRCPFFGLETTYDMFSDFAGQHFFALLDRCYPGSKFIVTTREMEAWLKSRESKVQKNLASNDYPYFWKQVDRPQWTLDRKSFFSEVETYFRGREQDLLVIDIAAGEGWETLCPFLGVPVPHIPFPWKNRLSTPYEPSLPDVYLKHDE